MTDPQLERARRVIDAEPRADLRVRGLTVLAAAGSPGVRAGSRWAGMLRPSGSCRVCGRA
jgi:hypothetical protein